MKLALTYESVWVGSEGEEKVQRGIALPLRVAYNNPELPFPYVTGSGQLHQEYALPVPSMCEDAQSVDPKVDAAIVHCWLTAAALRYLCQGVQLGKLTALGCNL
jgi:hypothetical protein